MFAEYVQTRHPGISDVKAKMAHKIKDERNALAKKANVKQEKEETDIKQGRFRYGSTA